jgi:predicted acetyltransferase
MDAPCPDPNQVLLRPLILDDEQDATAAHHDLEPENFEFLLDRNRSREWREYVAQLEATRLGVELPPDRVPATFLVAEVAGRLVGRVSLRHQLTPFLAQVGGHVGYAVRPAFRRRGYATAILRQTVGLAARLGLDRVLVTCEDTNVASAAVIERCGGVLENTVQYGSANARKRRYWVPTRSGG